MVTAKPKRRTRPLRQERSDVLLFVTNRTVEERFYLHPLLSAGAKPANRKARRALKGLDRLCDAFYERLAHKVNKRLGPHSPRFTGPELKRICTSLVGDALRRAQELTGVELFALLVMSNHIHLVIRTPNKNCAKFLRIFKSTLAKGINRITGRSGPLWARRADVQPILDDAAAAERVAYTLDNPRKAKLVADPEEWPGLSLCFGLTDAEQVPFEYFDYDAWRQARCPADKSPFFCRSALTLSPLPASEGDSPEDYARDVRAWLAAQVAAEQLEAESSGAQRQRKGCLGIEGVLKAALDQRPNSPKRSRRPYCFGSPAARRAHYADSVATSAAYDACSEAYLAGDLSVTFPPGTYPPPVICAAA